MKDVYQLIPPAIRGRRWTEKRALQLHQRQRRIRALRRAIFGNGALFMAQRPQRRCELQLRNGFRVNP